jgi:hypothetical protein
VADVIDPGRGAHTSDFDPPYLKSFYVVLPDAIPVPNGSTWTFSTDELEPLLDRVGFHILPDLPARTSDAPGRNFVSIRFLQVEDNTDTAFDADHQALQSAFERIGVTRADPTPRIPPAPVLNRYRTVAEMVEVSPS